MTVLPSVLILDEDPGVLQTLEMDLSQDFIVVFANSFLRFQELLQGRDFDLILTELPSKEASGIDIMQVIRKNIRYQSVPVVVHTGMADVHILERCILGGADAVFAKPVNTILLRARMRELLERKKRQENLIDRNQALRDLYLSREEFMTRVSHEFKTPIHAILGYTSLLIQKNIDPLTDRQRSFLERVEANAKTLLDLIEQTLNYKEMESRQNQVNLELIDIRKLVQDVIDNWQSLLIENSVHVSLESQLPFGLVLMDREKFQMIVSNLLSNAIKASHGGEIQIFLKGSRSEGKSYFLLHVEDTGMGMDEEKKDKIYRLFYSGKEWTKNDGMGIGLLNVKKSLEALCGSLYFESIKGKGTRFVLGFPLD